MAGPPSNNGEPVAPKSQIPSSGNNVTGVATILFVHMGLRLKQREEGAQLGMHSDSDLLPQLGVTWVSQSAATVTTAEYVWTQRKPVTANATRAVSLDSTVRAVSFLSQSVHTGRGAPRNRHTQKMELIVADESVYTHSQATAKGLHANLLRVLCERGLKTRMLADALHE